ncbi:antibiotic biosynthesis monooxygenase family protein [Mycobacterium kansasii]
MILEIGRITIKPGMDEKFIEMVSTHGAEIFDNATGCVGMQLRKSAVKPGSFALLLRWQTLDNHYVDFRESEGYGRWRELTTDLFAEVAEIDDFELVYDGGGISVD